MMERRRWLERRIQACNGYLDAYELSPEERDEALASCVADLSWLPDKALVQIEVECGQESDDSATFDKCLVDKALKRIKGFAEQQTPPPRLERCLHAAEHASDFETKLDFMEWCLTETGLNVPPSVEEDTPFRSPDQRPRKYICDRCGKSFVRPSELQRHIDAVHLELKPYVCDQCGKAFINKYLLKLHTDRVHLKLRPYICDWILEDGNSCSKAFARKSELEKHIEAVHQEKKPWVCDVCGETFKSFSSLDQHRRRIHEKERPHVCKECGMVFFRDTELKRHIDAVHRGKKPWVCDQCGRAFSQKSNLRQHERVCIPDTDETLKIKYHLQKGMNVENTIADIFEDNFGLSCTRGKKLTDPVLGNKIIDVYCVGIEGKRIAIDITTAETKSTIARKWKAKRYHDFSEVDELWVILDSPNWDKRRINKLNHEIHKKRIYQNVYIHHWKDLRNEKLMKIPPRIWKMLELYQQCTFKNVDKCKAHWEEIKEDFEKI